MSYVGTRRVPYGASPGKKVKSPDRPRSLDAPRPSGGSALAGAAGALVGVYYNSVSPTMGGVTASYAMLGDIIVAEPGALVGFAGPRVIEQTIKQELPEGFQRAEFLVQHGMLDAVVPRHEMRDYLIRALGILG